MATKRLEWRVLMDLVEPYGTGFQLAANALYRFQVLAPYRSAQAIDSIVGTGNHVGFI